MNNQLNYSLTDIPLDSILEYLSYTDWKIIEKGNPKWYIFVAKFPEDEKFTELVLPKDKSLLIYNNYLKSAIQILSELKNKPENEIAFSISNYDRDIFLCRNIEVETQESISLKQAAQQIKELKQLFAFAALSERHPEKPYFIDTQYSGAEKTIENFQFGHTFKGSFGFTILSPRINIKDFGTQNSVIPNEVEKTIVKPLERRVLERVVIGLNNTIKSVETSEIHDLMHGFRTGFNANMCRAIINMSVAMTNPLEFSVTWSPKIEPTSEILRTESSYLIEKTGFEYLQTAVEFMEKKESEEVTILCNVIDIAVNNNPNDSDTSRSVMVRWFDAVEGRVNKATIKLSMEDYLLACKAQQEWLPVKISGVLCKEKSNLYFEEYSIFAFS